MIRRNKGFTLIELLVGISIIGILSAAAVYSFHGATKDSQVVSSVNRINFIASKISQLAVKEGERTAIKFTNTAQGLKIQLYHTSPLGAVGNLTELSNSPIVLPHITAVNISNFSEITIPCTNRTIKVSNLLAIEKDGIAVCFNPNSSPDDNMIVFDRLGVPYSYTAGPMQCLGFVVLGTQKEPNKIKYGLLFTQTGNIMVCQKNKNGRWMR